MAIEKNSFKPRTTDPRCKQQQQNSCIASLESKNHQQLTAHSSESPHLNASKLISLASVVSTFGLLPGNPALTTRCAQTSNLCIEQKLIQLQTDPNFCGLDGWLSMRLSKWKLHYILLWSCTAQSTLNTQVSSAKTNTIISYLALKRSYHRCLWTRRNSLLALQFVLINWTSTSLSLRTQGQDSEALCCQEWLKNMQSGKLPVGTVYQDGSKVK